MQQVLPPGFLLSVTSHLQESRFRKLGSGLYGSVSEGIRAGNGRQLTAKENRLLTRTYGLVEGWKGIANRVDSGGSCEWKTKGLGGSYD